MSLVSSEAWPDAQSQRVSPPVFSQTQGEDTGGGVVPDLQALFLDSTAFMHCGLKSLPTQSTHRSAAVLEQISHQRQEIAQEYLASFHVPLAFISKNRFLETTLSLVDSDPDAALLLFCMKLLVSQPLADGEAPETAKLYCIARESVRDLDVHGTVTLTALQALLILCLYEIGHGIYPAAYLTIRACAQFGTQLGLDKGIYVFDNDPSRWREKEERDRAWWAILLLSQ